jgi:hypothetical protein
MRRVNRVARRQEERKRKIPARLMMLSARASAELYSEKEKLVLGAHCARVCVYAIVSLDASLSLSLSGSLCELIRPYAENSHNTPPIVTQYPAGDQILMRILLATCRNPSVGLGRSVNLYSHNGELFFV